MTTHRDRAALKIGKGNGGGFGRKAGCNRFGRKGRGKRFLSKARRRAGRNTIHRRVNAQ